MHATTGPLPPPATWLGRPAGRRAVSPDERPRERLAGRGAASLTDAELLAVVLGSGSRGRSAIDVAQGAIERCGGIAGLARASPGRLAAQPGVGRAKAARIAAGFEIARRVLALDIERGDPMTSPDAVRDFLRFALGPETVEVFVGLFLDSQHRLIASSELARGTLAQTSVYPREVVKAALAHNAAAVIFAHNHPSGVAEPSRADELLTQALRNALSLVDVRTLDHFIVAGATVTSFAERGLL